MKILFIKKNKKLLIKIFFLQKLKIDDPKISYLHKFDEKLEEFNYDKIEQICKLFELIKTITNKKEEKIFTHGMKFNYKIRIKKKFDLLSKFESEIKTMNNPSVH